MELTNDLMFYRNKILGLAQLTRFDRCLAAAGYTLVGAYLNDGRNQIASAPVVLSASVVAILVAFSYSMNDYQDILVDSIGKAWRPIPAGLISPASASVAVAILAVAAITLSLLLGWIIVLLTILCLALSAAYSFRLKETVLLGNATVAFLNGTIPIYGGLASGKVTLVVWLASSLTFFFVLPQEILFTIEDHDMDRLAGLSTTATRLGVGRALKLYAAFCIIFTIVALAPWVFALVSNQYLYAIVFCSIIPIISLAGLLSLKATDNTIRVASRITRWVRGISVISIVSLR
jgi:geranylgeranylglycerol-phosphate geranylgeranyltransferase